MCVFNEHALFISHLIYNKNCLQIKALLRGHSAFEDYPEHVKDQMAQVFVYQRYELITLLLPIKKVWKKEDVSRG